MTPPAVRPSDPPAPAGRGSAAAHLAPPGGDRPGRLTEERKVAMREEAAYWLGRAEQRDAETATREAAQRRAGRWKWLAKLAGCRRRTLRRT